jgi:hypothetical protein
VNDRFTVDRQTGRRYKNRLETMTTDLGPFLSVAALAVSAAVGGVTAWLALGKRMEEAALARAMRRTSALQLLTDEEFTLIRVRDECKVIQSLILMKEDKLGAAYDFLVQDAERILRESREMLADVHRRRGETEPRIERLQAAEIEAVIASAYHGKRLAEAQLERTLLSKREILGEFGVA